VVALVVAVFLVLSYFQMRGIENGVLATYADEQDGYIKLVVEQINPRGSRLMRSIMTTSRLAA
jgi:hypothetical protein